MLLMLLGIGLTAAIGAAYKVAPPQLNPLKSTMYYVKDAGLVDERYLAKGWCATNFSSNFELENKKEYLLKLIGNMEQIVVNFSGFEVVDEQSESVLILIKGG